MSGTLQRLERQHNAMPRCTCAHDVANHLEAGTPGRFSCTIDGCSCTDYTTKREPIEITTPTGGNVLSMIRICTDMAERALEAGDLPKACTYFEKIRKYAMNAQRAR